MAVQTTLFSSYVDETTNENASSTQDEIETMESKDLDERIKIKSSLLGIIGGTALSNIDPVLADPVSKQNLRIESTGPTLFGGQKSNRGVKVTLMSDENEYKGRSDTYYDLLRSSSTKNKAEEDPESNDSSKLLSSAINSLRVFVPPPLRGVLLPDENYIPMRDLFTSPQVSFLYERGWRQGFAAAGFPGADKEYQLVRDFFMPVKPDTVVDMSCATGLFTRRLAKGGDYKRVIGCDYSESMLSEARRRIEDDPELQNDSSTTKLDLVRCDVGDLPMSSESIKALHAGAAMHCWPDLDAALSEIYRVLQPGGRYFASTFLASYFSTVQSIGGTDNINSQAFQYFESTDKLKNLLLKAGFQNSNIDIEVLQPGCVIIKAIK
jgi:ubiquinone/menaquinone biosynthesis C-methylase UbiE